MSLRPSLILGEPDKGKIDRIRAIVECILGSIHHGTDPSDDIDKIRELSGRDYDLEYFRTLHSHSSIDEFAEEASLPLPVRIPDITRDELIEILKLAMQFKEPDLTYYCQLFDANVPMPGASNLLLCPEDWKNSQDISNYEPTAEEIVERALDPDKIIRL